ncbi:MAG TPA: cytochrome c oxidase assembly protein, partial [Gemmatimonadaceae bacterium]|nr:cytochrome c oxidase assembly protein [Gemmatimonadaceae bacterium]
MVPDIRPLDLRENMMLLHAGAPLAPHDAWMAWSFEPGVVIPLALTAFIYVRGAREFRKRSTRNAVALGREMWFFIAGFSVLALALMSPLHQIGGALFSAHMVQHELLMAIAAPLLVLGRPAVPMLWGLPGSVRKPVGKVFTTGLLRGAWRFLTLPLVAFLLHAAAIWVWHAPSLYDASVTNELVHTAQHLSFLGTALLFWWSVFHGRGNRKSDGSAILWLFATAVHTSLLGALMTGSDSPWYAAYHDSTTMQWGLTTLADQQLGGIVMWVPGGVVYMIAALYLVLGFMRESGERVKKSDRARRAATAIARGSAALIALILIAGCDNHDTQWAAEMTGGNPQRGAEAMRSYGCQSCHSIPGIT